MSGNAKGLVQKHCREHFARTPMLVSSFPFWITHISLLLYMWDFFSPLKDHWVSVFQPFLPSCNPVEALFSVVCTLELQREKLEIYWYYFKMFLLSHHCIYSYSNWSQKKKNQQVIFCNPERSFRTAFILVDLTIISAVKSLWVKYYKNAISYSK